MISIRPDKVGLVKEIFRQMKIEFRYNFVSDGEVVKFKFKASKSNLIRLINAVPRDAYSYNGIIDIDND